MFIGWKPWEVTDPDFGRLTYARGVWRGRIAALGPGAVPLEVCGSRRAPDAAALLMVRSLCARYAVWRTLLGRQLLEHLLPLREAVDSGALPPPAEPLPDIRHPGEVWPYVATEFVAVAPVGGRLTLDVGYCVMWDEEHILRARFQEGRFVELRGSTLCPQWGRMRLG
ncbi:MAG: hypothetical protein KDF54_14200 [Hydrogenophaga sp.]|nr:hypothetical protein [Hydrogenophaga sp.]